MFPEEFKSILVSLAEEQEDMKTLLGLFHLVEGYATEETLVKNLGAITGRDCRELLKSLRRKGILKIGTYNEYLCLSGYEEFFNEIARGYAPQPGDLARYIEHAIAEGDSTALKLVELILKTGKYGTPGYTQYEIIRAEMSALFSPEIFHSQIEKLIRERLCVYAKKRDEEFIEFFTPENKLEEVKGRLRAWKSTSLMDMPVVKALEREIEDLVADARHGIKEYSAEIARSAGLSEQDVEKTVGYFSGFEMDENFMFVTGNMLIDHDTLYIAITDSLSWYEAREWRSSPAVFITAEDPRWVGKIEAAFRDAYPKFSERRIAIVVPNKVAYANFKQKLLSELVNRLGIAEIAEFPKISERRVRQPVKPTGRQIDEFTY
ncbi:MAG: hypothetical protein EFT35_06025 [Methanophagales archaeon ANME-1-THS]|nr:MAG: hypothetical protein EFT35_06025 [Methanophagales archaeon ANME-1-THS]